jgi:hypothetical protein
MTPKSVAAAAAAAAAEEVVAAELTHHQQQGLLNAVDKFDADPGVLEALLHLLAWKRIIVATRPDMEAAFSARPVENNELWDARAVDLKRLLVQRLGGHARDLVMNNKNSNENWADLLTAYTRGINLPMLLYTFKITDFPTAAKLAIVLRAIDEQLQHLTQKEKVVAIFSAFNAKRGCPEILISLTATLSRNITVDALVSAICDFDAEHEIFAGNSFGAGTALVMYTSNSNTVEACTTCGGLLHDARACPSDPRAVNKICTWCYVPTHSTENCRQKTQGYTTGKPRLPPRSLAPNWRNNNNKPAHVHAVLNATKTASPDKDPPSKGYSIDMW